MTQQPTDNETAVVTSATDSGDDDPVDSMPNNFKWTTKPEKSLLFNMIRLKPSGKLSAVTFLFLFYGSLFELSVINSKTI